MNTQEFVSSGVLELYVANALSQDEMRDVEYFAQRYPEVRAELVAVERAIEAFVLAHAVAPPPGVKDAFLNTVSAETEKRLTTRAEHLAQQLPRRSRVPYILLTVLTVLTLAALGAAGFFYWQWQESFTNAPAAGEETDETAQTLALVQDSLRTLRHDLGAILHRNTKTIPVRGSKLAPQAGAVVYWNPSTKDVYLSIRELAPPAAGGDYQLWAVRDGKYVNAGIIDTKITAIQKMLPVERAQTFTVTLEPKGGSETPSKDKIYLTGKI